MPLAAQHRQKGTKKAVAIPTAVPMGPRRMFPGGHNPTSHDDRGMTPQKPAGKQRGATDSKLSRLAVTREEAAASIGCSVDFFDDHIRPYLRVRHVGRRVVIPVSELERWLDGRADGRRAA